MLLVHAFPDGNVNRVGTAGKSDWHPRPEQFRSAFRQNVLRAVRGTDRAENGADSMYRADSTYRADSCRGTVRTFPMT
ncbi:hypothetical protein OG775_10970 [Streptomyces platensis]|uniref:hypothetical protein n=1 Tax=Streptomyces platensis TaxID=58346 RepID=UPI002251B2C1|nr:hypothetical protein [Streptomyces platensis]MCX4635649.1 hypothetical protein [Streptomyces platensis]